MKRNFFCLLAIIAVFFFNGCGPDTIPYDNEAWANAFKKQEILKTAPQKVTEFKEIYKRPALSHIDGEKLYLLNAHDWTVNIYSTKDFQFKVTFGGQGEGPGQFRAIQGFWALKEHLVVNSPSKHSYFSRNGELLREVRSPPELIPLQPVGENFITREYTSIEGRGVKGTPDTEMKFVLVGPDFEKKKTLFKKVLNTSYTYVNDGTTLKRVATLFSNYCRFRVYKDNIYIGLSTTEGFLFMVFDSNGKKLYKIARPYAKRKIPDAIKEAIRANNMKRKTRPGRPPTVIEFYDHYPAFSDFRVRDDKIYVFLYPEIDKQRVLIMDLKGNLLGVSLIPFDVKTLEESSYRVLFRNIIYNGARYFLKDNDLNDSWELWRLNIEEAVKPS